MKQITKRHRSIYEVGEHIHINSCVCGKHPHLDKQGNTKRLLFQVHCDCGKSSPHSKFAYKAILQWNMSKHSKKPHYTEIPRFCKCTSINQAKSIVMRMLQEVQFEYVQFMSHSRNKSKRSFRRTKLNMELELSKYYLWLCEYWEREFSHMQ